MTQLRAFLLFALFLFSAATAEDHLTIAVASNFRGSAEKIAEAFTNEAGVSVRLSSGSTGKLYAQIVNGAPYDIFLAADMERPRLLEKAGDAIDGSLMTYAIGKLVLISVDPALKGQSCSGVLRSGSYRRMAIANPATAPYGAAAKAYLIAAGLWGEALPKLIMGENISQAFQFVATANATLGIVAESQLTDDSPVQVACQSPIDVPENDVLQQGAVILRRTGSLELARSFMRFLGSETTRALITSYGYEVPSQ